jgi:hypothetical protein
LSDAVNFEGSKMRIEEMLAYGLRAAVGAVCAFSALIEHARCESLQLSSSYKNENATLVADVTRFAGAVHSFKWGDMEFIDSFDHGRELQSAVVFDDLAGCFNPTEAGSANDYRSGNSSSRVLKATVQRGHLLTSVDAAFWLAPGQETRTCGKHSKLRNAVNNSLRAGYIIEKDVKFGINEVKNALEWVVHFTVPEPHASADFEVLTGYMPAIFSVSRELDIKTGQLSAPMPPEHDRLRPLVVSAPDDRFAMGIICPSDKPIRYQFITFSRQRVVKWNCVAHDTNLFPMIYAYRAYVFFGTTEDVRNGMVRTLRIQPR